MDISAGRIPRLDWEVACPCNIKHSLATAPVQGHWISNGLLQILKRGRKKKSWALLEKKYLDLHFSRVEGGVVQGGVSCCLCVCLRQVRDSRRQVAYEQCDARLPQPGCFWAVWVIWDHGQRTARRWYREQWKTDLWCQYLAACFCLIYLCWFRCQANSQGQ